ncbi:leucine-rich repeat flightless-interacting protein 1 isoform X1 [Oncorhynchus tshawytscha]|uniref:leucine-rich repeat flightless-interacting protein 1 isoform X1 n=1 Tax=Oncorhynchus tshawytscha TaxID=74940 RepID=UPI001C3C462D|nr:leucine-rich repeat flightless-interacting protein 1 isoform X1 [Oncorhynchus tshawytscha]XP_042171058.1 leucine-rich repeat flightless-interacting protein 1 isoform X1 [Oncorhynchus tshawytscha]XP_042171060.1 leucine-rich repeat flightless-interacting protein 1 isoform X1 [Oncorhynchus tshawytscha]
MGTQGTGRKRNPIKDRSTAEDDTLNLIAREAEARLALKRAARAEAREIRMKELEGQQEEVEDRDFLEKGSQSASTITAATLASLSGSSSRSGSGELSMTGDTETSILENKDSLVEEKYRKAMVSNAQLDNEKNNLMYQVDRLKDSLMELEELLSESRREYDAKTKDFECEKHAYGVLQFQFNVMKETLKQSEELLTEICQLRLKQDSFVREISDLQETVEWKDEKIGALEQQKRYSDAIKNERDDLRNELVQLKDILKKHGIVLGPNLTTNGEKVEMVTERSASRDPASQLAQDSHTSPTERGNIMLGRAQDMELGSRGDKMVDPGRSRPQVETHEAVQESHLTSPTPCSLAGVSETKTSMEARPCSPKLGVEIECSNVNKDSDNGILVVEVKHGPVCDSEVIVVVTVPEEELTGEGYKPAGMEGTVQGRVEATNKWEMGIKNDKADDMEAKVTKSSDHTKEPTSEYGALAEQDNIALRKEVVKSIDSCPHPRETIEDTIQNGTQISPGTDHDTSKSAIKSECKPQPKLQKTKAEALSEITDTQPQAQGGKKKKKKKGKKGERQGDEKQEDYKKSTTEKGVVSMKNSTQIPQRTNLDTTKSPVESKAKVLPEATDMQPLAQGGKKRKKGKKGETQGDENQGDDNKRSKTEKDVDSVSTDKEPVVEEVITIETQELLEGTGSSPNRELQSPKEKAQTIAEGGNLKEEEQQLAEGRVEVKSEEPPIETPEVSLTDQAKSEEVVKKDHQKPSMESEKSEGEISVLCHECDIGIVDPVNQQCITNCVTSADNPKEKFESTTNTGTQKDESGYTTNPDNFVDCLNSSADPKCPLDLKESTAENSNNVKEEDAIKVSVDETQTIQDTKEEGINFHSRIVLRPALEKRMVPEDLIANDGVITHPEHVTENAIKYLKVAGQDEQNGSPDECKNALEHKDISIALPASVDKCKNVSGENCGTSLDSNCPAPETIRQPEQLMDLPGCPVADKHLDDNNEPVTLDEEKASNGGISTETELDDTETRLQDPVKETPETIDSFREQGSKESKPCTMVAEAEEQDDPIEAKLEGNKVPGPSEQGNGEGDDDIDEGQLFDFNDLDSVVSANVFPVTSQEVSQEVRMMEGNKMEVEPDREKAIKEEEDWDKSTGKPQGTVDGVSTIVAKQPLERGSDSAPE